LQPLAEQGHAEAQTLLGDLYLSGRGVEGDAAAAVTWYWAARKQGYAPAMRALAKCYEVGLGVPRDMTAAERLYADAAQQETFDLGPTDAPQ
jgi:hypothetical protein